MELYYTKDHEWIKVEGDVAVAGITGYAAGQLGDITYIELPREGSGVKKGDILCEIESVKAASEVFSPVSGKITEVNKELENSPETLNSSPQEEGWIAKIQITGSSEKDSLMSPGEYEEYLDQVE